MRRGDTPALLPRREGGSVTVWAAIVLPACFAVFGLVLDGGVLLRAQSATFDLAGAAARHGAQELDEGALARGEVRLDHTRARAAAVRFLERNGATGEAIIDGSRITVTARRVVALQVLRPARVPIVQHASAEAVQPGGP